MIEKKSAFRRTYIVVSRYLFEAIMLGFSALMMLPFYYLVNSTFRKTKDVALAPLSLPRTLNIENYIESFKQMRFITAFGNTFILTFASLALVLLLGSMAGYSISRRKHKLYRIIMLYFLLGFMVPVQTTMIPLFKLMKSLNLINKLYGIIIMSSGGCTFALFLYQGFINTIPYEIEEAAIIDGASVPSVYWHIILPLLKPITVTVSIFHVMGTWNDFVMPFLFLHSRENTTLMLELYRGVGEFSNNWPIMMTSMVIIMAPLVIFYLFAQRYIIEGLTSGAVKA